MTGRLQPRTTVSGLLLPACLFIQGCLLFAWPDLLPVWGDEHFTLRAASGSARQALEVIAWEKNNPPLHTLLLHFWLLIPWPLSKIAAARGLSALFALASTAVMDKFWLRHAPPASRRWFLALWTLSPCLLLYARIARPYSLMLLLFLVALKMAVDFLERPTSVPGMLRFGAGVTVLLYAHYLPGLALLASVLLILSWRAARPGQRALLGPAGVVVLLVAALYGPWLPKLGVALQRMALSPPAAPSAGGWISELIRPGYLLFSFGLGETPPLWVLLSAVMAIPGILFLVWRGARPRLEWLTPVLLAALIGYLAAGRWVAFVFTPGRLLFLLPFFLLLTALGTQRSPRIGRLVCAALLCLSAGSLSSYFAKRDFLNKSYLLPYDEIARTIRAGSPGGNAILLADACNMDPSPLLDMVPKQMKRILVTPRSTPGSLRLELAAAGAGDVWCFRNTHDTSPGGVNGLLEKELAAGRAVRRWEFVPYSRRDRWFMQFLGWRERPAHFVQLLEIRGVGSGPP